MKPEWVDEYNDGKQYIPSYNIAPTDVTPIMISANLCQKNASYERIIKPMMWGMIPPWQKVNELTYLSEIIFDHFINW